jgi:hypothetical protein
MLSEFSLFAASLQDVSTFFPFLFSKTNHTLSNNWNPQNTQKTKSAKHPGRDVLNGVQRVPVPCLVTPAEGKGISCPASWVTLQDLVCNGWFICS